MNFEIFLSNEAAKFLKILIKKISIGLLKIKAA